MKLGDFFINAAKARAINAKPISFTAVTHDKTTLPGGAANRTKRQVAAVIDACFEFVGADNVAEARRAARKAEREINPGEAVDENDFDVEVQYQILARAIREYDPREKTAGDALFVDAKQMRELVELVESNRLIRAYNAYVQEEHPEVVDNATFREAQKGSG